VYSFFGIAKKFLENKKRETKDKIRSNTRARASVDPGAHG
jgi:hypothetical protein